MSEKTEKEAESKGLSRREFIAATGAAVAGLAVGAAIGSQAFPRVVEVPGPVKTVTTTATTTATTTTTVPTPVMVAKSGVIVRDSLACQACGLCEAACSLAHEGASSRELSRIILDADMFTGDFDAYVCQQCDSPSCYFACPVKGAIKIDEKTGARYIDEKVCTGCGLCAKACPMNNIYPVLKSKTLAGKTTYFMCDLCKDRTKGPACVEFCPTEALKYVPATKR